MKTSSDERPIGIFDSGVGGLTVAKAVKEKLPNESIIYYGDTVHMPYGDKSKDVIVEYSRKISEFLFEQDCKAIVIACNTASSNAYDELSQEIGTKSILVDVINPTVEYIADKVEYKKGCVIGTKSTIESGAYEYKIQKRITNASLISLATPLLAPMVEEGFVSDKISDLVISSYLSDRKLEGIEYLILGCTHYPLIKEQIEKFFDHNVEVYNSSVILVDYLYDILSKKGLLNKSDNGSDMFYVSDYTEGFTQTAKMFFGDDIKLEKNNIW
jgi:glutamate racemase